MLLLVFHLTPSPRGVRLFLFIGVPLLLLSSSLYGSVGCKACRSFDEGPTGTTCTGAPLPFPFPFMLPVAALGARLSCPDFNQDRLV